MYCGTKLYVTSTLTSLLILVTSCVGILKIYPPGPDNQTLLVLPVYSENTSPFSTYAYYYVYEIVNVSDSENYDAIFNLPIEDGMLIVNSLPPGTYHVEKFMYLPIGSFRHSFEDTVEHRYDKFKLEAGKITIFHNSLMVSMIENPTEPGAITYHTIRLLSANHKAEIMKTLTHLDNFDKWEISFQN